MKKRSKISKKIFKAILIIQACVLAAILFFVILEYCLNDFGKNTIMCCIVIFLSFGIMIPFFTMPLFIMFFKNTETFKESEKYVLQNLSKEYCLEVIPIKDEPQHENFLTKELVKRAKFYAQIMSDGTVMISIKFNNESNRIYYGGLYAKDFTRHFKVLNS